MAIGIALSVLLTWLYNATRGGLLFAMVLHGGFNTWLSSVWLLRNGIDPASGWMVAGIVVVATVVLVGRFGCEHLAAVPRQTAGHGGS